LSGGSHPERRPASGGGAAISVHGLTKRFGRLTAVNDVTFDVARGEVFGLLGPNGAGKSTTIRMLCGITSASEGSASVAGYDIDRDPEDVRQNIGYMSQRFSLYRDLTVAENIRFFGGVYGLEGERLSSRMRDVVRLAGLEGLENEITGTLSGALAQRLALGCAVIHEPPIVFLDEPTSGVDPISRRLFWDLVREMSARGVTVLITTHFMDEAEYCDRLGFITGGRLIALDTPDNLRCDAVREDVFAVTLSDLAGARKKMKSIDDVVSTMYFGQRLHVFAKPGALDVRSLESAMRGQGLDVTSVEKTEPTLEDAFVRLAEADTPGGLQ
jgi:ABC-2 type transport system ATP-binding protein